MTTLLGDRLAPLRARMDSQRSHVRPVSRLWFEISDKHAFETSIELCLKWMQPRTKTPLPPSAWQGEAFDLSDVLGANPSRAVRINAADGALWAGRLDFPDPVHPRTWISEFFAEKKSGELSRFGAQLTCVVRGESPEYEITRPTVARHVIEKLSAEADGRQLTEVATKVAREDVHELVGLIYEPDRRLPVIAISETEAAATLLSPDVLARQVAGAAHVFHLSNEASWELTKSIGKRMSTFNGAVRLYLQGLSEETEDPFQHPLWLYRETPDYDLAPSLAARVLQASFLRSKSLEEFHRFSFVRDLAARHSIPQLVPANDISALNEENSQLRAQLSEVAEERDEWDSLAHEEQNKRIAADVEIERLKSENARLAAKSEALERQFQERTGTSAQETAIPPAKNLQSYDDLEDWADEVLGEHVIIHNAALKDCRKNGHPNTLSRIADVLIVVRDYWVPAKLNGGIERWEVARAKLREIGLEDSACFVDREEAKRTAGYSVQYEGEARILYDHLKYGNGYDNANQIRIYYFWDEDRKRFVVGKMPSHLRNNLTT